VVDLSGRVALIGGASGGVGSVVATVLAECGSDVALGCHNHPGPAEQVADQARKLGRQASLRRVDAAILEDAQRWANEVIAEHGHIDLLANCIGWPGKFELFKDQSPDTWHSALNAQLWPCINLSYAVLQHMLERGSGRMITLASDGAKLGTSGVAVATAAIGGQVAFYKSLARELARTGITVNAVCIGPTEGPILDKLLGQGDTGAKIVEAMVRGIPMKRLGKPREIANMFAFLASDEAAFITGQAISVSGGLTMY